MANQLHHESSLYLKQHKDNPVNWLPWSKVSFELAKKENKPIFLSIGYSACHWCHVMAHECFEDDEVSLLLNKLFICIKVDKEERPDIDHIYQSAHYIFNRKPGGWPLSVFMTPEQEPYFIGTYIPKNPKYNLPGMNQILPKLSQFFKNEKDSLKEQTKQIKEIIQQSQVEVMDVITIDPEFINLAVKTISNQIDDINGGFGHAPKFPNEPLLNLLIQRNDNDIQDIINLSLNKIMSGGIFDHIGGGFFRYCVDEKWTIPHYEKMLYNSAQLLVILAHHFNKTKDNFTKKIISLTISWLNEWMKGDLGGFYSSVDADSLNHNGELEEGAFYNWSETELRKELSEKEHKELSELFTLEGSPNFENYLWHLNLKDSISHKSLDRIRIRLKKIRSTRIRPTTDKKIITSWNALLIKGLLKSGDLLKNDEWIDIAQENINFLSNNLFDGDILNSIYIDNKAKFPGYLDDYAFLLDALILSLQVNYREKDLVLAIKIGNQIINQFQSDNGGYYFTSHSHEMLFNRQMLSEDSATPSANGIACIALQELSVITNNTIFSDSSYKSLLHWNNQVKSSPYTHPTLLRAYQYYLGEKNIVYIYGKNSEIKKWKNDIGSKLLGKTLIIYIDYDSPSKLLIKRKYYVGGVAYLCKNYSCLPEILNSTELLDIFDN
ncbi:MAG: thioredoxin domain-containing protein [Methylophilaceae bacterium]|jgi:uncharacterized protein|nr:thioredoxin domain-containing protein [Methylophilaceae bacterium]